MGYRSSINMFTKHLVLSLVFISLVNLIVTDLSEASNTGLKTSTKREVDQPKSEKPTGASPPDASEKRNITSESPRGNTQLSTNPKNENENNLKGSINCSLPANKNMTTCKSDEGLVTNIFKKMSDNSAMLFRTMLVLLGVTSIVIIYFVVRAVRLRRRRSKSRKYGVITKGNRGGDMEMEPLGDGSDDDDDYTVFEMNGQRK